MTATLTWTAAIGLVLLVTACGGGSSNSPPVSQGTPLPIVAAAPPADPPRPANPDQAAVERARPSLQACYERARAANPALGRTTVTLSLRVEETGNVSTVDLDYKHKFDDASKQCMRDASFAIKLPPGAPRRVEVPMTFETR